MACAPHTQRTGPSHVSILRFLELRRVIDMIPKAHAFLARPSSLLGKLGLGGSQGA